MRIVAFTALPHRSWQMLTCGIEHLILKIAMTTQAELLLRFGGNPLVIAGMRVMAGHAFAIIIRHVNSR